MSTLSKFVNIVNIVDIVDIVSSNINKHINLLI